VSESADGDGSRAGPPDDTSRRPADLSGPGTVPVATDVSPRPHADPDPLGLDVAPTFPDDGPLSRGVRKLDDLLGRIEQAFVFGLLALVVIVASLAALHDRFTSEHLGRWWHYIVRGGTFATAMFGAVFATQQQRHLAMDLISRRLSPRGRLVLGVALKLLTIGIAGLLFDSGLRQREVAGGSESLEFLGLRIVDADIVTSISIGAALIALHSLLHMVIDLDYLVRGKLPPERARSGH
jgi:TRAP-type C4-dicarboxylate transport system permease small subunit